MLALPVKGSQAAGTGTITQKAHEYLILTYSEQAPLADTRIQVKPLSPVLNKRRCNNPVSFSHKPSRGSRLSFKAICDSPKWTIFLSATIEQWQPVAVTNRAMTKDTILGASDIFLKPVDIRRVTTAYFTDPAELIGRSLRRSVSSNQIIKPTLVRRQLLIRKGEIVYIEASKSTMTIRMTGTAQKDGAKGEQIPVINNRSGKIVHGYVTEQGVISVSPP